MSTQDNRETEERKRPAIDPAGGDECPVCDEGGCCHGGGADAPAITTGRGEALAGAGDDDTFSLAGENDYMFEFDSVEKAVDWLTDQLDASSGAFVWVEAATNPSQAEANAVAPNPETPSVPPVQVSEGEVVVDRADLKIAMWRAGHAVGCEVRDGEDCDCYLGRLRAVLSEGGSGE